MQPLDPLSRGERAALLLLAIVCLWYPGPMQLPVVAVSLLAGRLESPSQRVAFELTRATCLLASASLIYGRSRR